MGREDDHELLARSGTDPGAFGVFYRRHERAMVAFVGRQVRDPDLTVDVVAETFARAYAGREGFDPARGVARAWLLGIAAHVIAASWRRGQVEYEARRRLGMERVVISQRTRDEVERAVLESEDAVVEFWLADLPVEQAEAVRRRVLQEVDYDVIAEQLACSPAVVRQRVSRGLARLRALSRES